MAFYPDFGNYSECIISLVFESKQYANLKDKEVALRLLENSRKYYKIYAEQYP
jgi:hypothetical protein